MYILSSRTISLVSFVVMSFLFFVVTRVLRFKWLKHFFKWWIDILFVFLLSSLLMFVVNYEYLPLIQISIAIIYIFLFYVLGFPSIGKLILCKNNEKKGKHDKLKGVLSYLMLFSFVFLLMLFGSDENFLYGNFKPTQEAGYFVNNQGDILLDENDGMLFLFQDTNKDGTVDTLKYDIDGDEKFDFLIKKINDTNRVKKSYPFTYTKKHILWIFWIYFVVLLIYFIFFVKKYKRSQKLIQKKGVGVVVIFLFLLAYTHQVYADDRSECYQMAQNYDVASARFQELNCMQYFTQEEVNDYLQGFQQEEINNDKGDSEYQYPDNFDVDTSHCFAEDANGQLKYVECNQGDTLVGEDLEEWAVDQAGQDDYPTDSDLIITKDDLKRDLGWLDDEESSNENTETEPETEQYDLGDDIESDEEQGDDTFILSQTEQAPAQVKEFNSKEEFEIFQEQKQTLFDKIQQTDSNIPNIDDDTVSLLLNNKDIQKVLSTDKKLSTQQIKQMDLIKASMDTIQDIDNLGEGLLDLLDTKTAKNIQNNLSQSKKVQNTIKVIKSQTTKLNNIKNKIKSLRTNPNSKGASKFLSRIKKTPNKSISQKKLGTNKIGVGHVLDVYNMYNTMQDFDKHFHGDKEKTAEATLLQTVVDKTIANNPVDLVVGLTSSALSLVGKDKRAKEVSKFTVGDIANQTIKNAVQDDFGTTLKEIDYVVKSQRDGVKKSKGFFQKTTKGISAAITTSYAFTVLGVKGSIEGVKALGKDSFNFVSRKTSSGMKSVYRGTKNLFAKMKGLFK